MVAKRKGGRKIASKPKITPAADNWVTEGVDPDVEALSSLEQSTEIKGVSFLPLHQIKDRESDIRNQSKQQKAHVEGLALSIAAVGLIEPLVVDQKGVLLAGASRRAAIALLADGASGDKLLANMFPDGIPVRVMPFCASEDKDKALQVEVAENEHRRDFTPSEIKKIIQRLKDEGYEHGPGQPKKGSKRLKPVLKRIIGKSMRTVERYLAIEKNETPTNGEVNHTEQRDRHLRRAIAALEKWQAIDETPKKRRETKLAKSMPNILEQLKSGMDDGI